VIALTVVGNEVHIADTASGKRGVFLTESGKRVRGDLEMTPDEVLFMVWRQKQNPKLKDD